LEIKRHGVMEIGRCKAFSYQRHKVSIKEIRWSSILTRCKRSILVVNDRSGNICETELKEKTFSESEIGRVYRSVVHFCWRNAYSLRTKLSGTLSNMSGFISACIR
jgi:hypothetical protein